MANKFGDYIPSDFSIMGSSFVPEFTNVPRVEHKWKQGMKYSYHRRIQKKWNKRYGYRQERAVFILAGGLIVIHPNTLNLLRSSIQNGKAHVTHKISEAIRKAVNKELGNG